MGLGPSTKETTLLHYRDPLTALLAADPHVDFQAVIFAGTSDDDRQKHFVAGRIGALLEAMRVDGVIVSIDSWGNCHIDFAAVLEAIGERAIPLSALSFAGRQAEFVVTNSHMRGVIDLNKTAEGIETCIMGQNGMDELDALKALTVLKSRIRRKHPGKEWIVRERRQVRRLVRRQYLLEDVRVAPAAALTLYHGLLTLDTEALAKAAWERARKDAPEARGVRMALLRPGETDVSVNSILDFLPLAAKAAGRTGEGITHQIDNCRVMLCAVEEGGFQPINVGAAYGRLGDVVVFDRPGTPAKTDFILHVDVTLADGQGRTREGMMAAHRICDECVRDVRDALKALPRSQAARSEALWDEIRPGGLRIAVVKLVPGLGCMHDTVLFGDEPCGFIGGKSIMDVSNKMGMALSPNEYRDGALRSLS